MWQVVSEKKYRFASQIALFIVLIPAILRAETIQNTHVNLCDLSKEALVLTQQVRGLSQKRAVPCEVQNRTQVEKFILATVQEQMPENLMHTEGLALSAIGFIADDFDYARELVDLYVSQVGGYYDPKRATYVMAGWLPGYLQRSVAVHELTHALQDQHFELESFLKEDSSDLKIRNTDRALALSALVEGDAMAVMIDFARSEVGAPGIASEESVNSILFQNLLGAGLVMNSTGAPQSIMKLLMFPYTSGLRFVHQVLKVGGYEQVNTTFEKPPRSTEEILHYEKYLAKEADFSLISLEDTLESYPALQSSQLLYQNVIGEFMIAVLMDELCQRYCDASQLGQGWGGDSLFLFRDDELGQQGHLLLWRLHWDSESDANEFFAKFSEFYGKARAEVKQVAGSAELLKYIEDSSFKGAAMFQSGRSGDILIRF
jgi:hypothetical protein